MERLHKIELQSRGGVTNERVHANPSVIRVTRTIIQEGVLERVVINFRDTWSMENMRHNHGYHESITWEVIVANIGGGRRKRRTFRCALTEIRQPRVRISVNFSSLASPSCYSRSLHASACYLYRNISTIKRLLFPVQLDILILYQFRNKRIKNFDD